MQKTRTVTTDNLTFTVSEMTLTQIHAWYEKLVTPGGPCDIVDEYSLPDISLSDLAVICNCDVAEFDDLSHRELDWIATAAREMNPHFFKLRALVAETAKKIVEAVTYGFPSPAEVK